MGANNSTEAGEDGEEKEMGEAPSADGLETMDAPEVLRFSESGGGGGAGGGGGGGGGAGGGGGGGAGAYGAVQQIDIAAPMDIAGTPRGGAAKRMDNSMPDSSFASSFGSFMSPLEGAALGAPASPATACRAAPPALLSTSRCC